MDFEIRDKGLQRLWEEGDSAGRYEQGLEKLFRRRIQTIQGAPDERLFYGLKSLHYEKLSGDRSHQRSMRLNKQWRLILEIEERADGKLVAVISIEDYH